MIYNLERISSVARTLFYLLLYRSRFIINPFRSFIHGRIYLSKGTVTIDHGFRNRRNLCININGGKLIIKSNVFINNNVSINCHDSITIGTNTIIGENVSFYDHDHSHYDLSMPIKDQGFITSPILIGNNVWVGSNVVILKGTTIGDNCIVAAGSVINTDIPENTIVVQKRNQIYKSRC